MMFDANISVIDMDVIAPEVDETGKAPADAGVTVVLGLGIVMPTPQGMATLPLGVLRFRLGKNAAQENGGLITKAAELISESAPKSDIIIPGGMGDVEALAKQAKVTEQMRAK